MNKVKKIVTIALLLALEIVLARFFSIRTPIVTIGFSFLPLMIVAKYFGPKWSTLVATLSDLIGALLFPTGPYFIGYTISNALSGLVYGVFLYDKDGTMSRKQFLIRLISSTLIVALIINMGLNTIWTFITTKSAVKVIAPIRIIKQLVLIPIKVIVMYFVSKAISKPLYSMLEEEND